MQQWKIRNASEIVRMFIGYAYTCTQYVFDTERTIEEGVILKSLIQQYLYRQGVIEPVSRHTKQFEL